MLSCILWNVYYIFLNLEKALELTFSGIYFVNFDLSVFTVICPEGLNWPGVLAGIFLLNWLQWMMFTIFSGTRVCFKDYENHCSLEFIHGVFLMKRAAIYKIPIKPCVRNLIQRYSVEEDKAYYVSPFFGNDHVINVT